MPDSSEQKAPVAWLLLGVPLFALFCLPIIALVQRAAGAGVLSKLSDPSSLAALRVSLETSLIALCITVGLGLPLAWILARGRLPLHKLWDTLIDLPIVLPPSVAGIALLMAFGRNGLLGPWLDSLGLHLPFTAIAVVLAQMFVAGPLFVRAASNALVQVDREAEQSAAMDGASRSAVLSKITLPLVKRQLAGGAIMAWARGVGEFGATLIFAGNLEGKTQTMPLAIYLGLESDLNVALALSALMLGIAFVALLVAKSIVK